MDYLRHAYTIIAFLHPNLASSDWSSTYLANGNMRCSTNTMENISVRERQKPRKGEHVKVVEPKRDRERVFTNTKTPRESAAMQYPISRRDW